MGARLVRRAPRDPARRERHCSRRWIRPTWFGRIDGDIERRASMADVDLSGLQIVDAHTHPYRMEDLLKKGSEGFDTVSDLPRRVVLPRRRGWTGAGGRPRTGLTDLDGDGDHDRAVARASPGVRAHARGGRGRAREVAVAARGPRGVHEEPPRMRPAWWRSSPMRATRNRRSPPPEFAGRSACGCIASRASSRGSSRDAEVPSMTRSPA